MITEGKNGFLIQPKDPKRLAEKLKTLLLLSEEERANISKNAIESIKENYSQEVILRKMIAYYEECIENQANY
jgi:glycosyltransferase involved in cell wall biosynthesis